MPGETLPGRDLEIQVRSDLRRAFDEFVEPVHVLASGVIVGHALWISRWLAPGGRAPLQTAYVEAVATDPSHPRGRSTGGR